MKDGTLDAPLTAAAEFLYIDPDLLAAAAAGSAQAAADEPTAAQLRTWVVRLPAWEKDTSLTGLITRWANPLEQRLRAQGHRTSNAERVLAP